MISHIFREYDIRGLYPHELNQDMVYRLGRALGTNFKGEFMEKVATLV